MIMKGSFKMKENGAVKRILSILELISVNPQGLTLGEIHRKLNMPKSTAYDILQTLYLYDAVYYKNPDLKNYVIGSRMYAIGSVYTANSSFIETSLPHMREFSERTGFTTQIAKRVENKVVYIGKYIPNNVKIITETDVGSIFYGLDKEIAGKCFHLYDRNVNNGKRNTNKTYIETLSGSTNHIQNIAVPVKNFENRVVGVLVASDLYNEDTNIEMIASQLKEIRNRISKGLGYLGDFDE